MGSFKWEGGDYSEGKSTFKGPSACSKHKRKNCYSRRAAKMCSSDGTTYSLVPHRITTMNSDREGQLVMAVLGGSPRAARQRVILRWLTGSTSVG
ncbi:hypothetical protein Nepgr_017113 [Nepenthes gracilis]|uniref:Uncharacterized protein n=1 Tax=Nepenthes gracilis TaxID=150966 RepID=A0AAD3SRT2_NEPGR|nr:hypothetical protein Nepgr_017113 [Nepenthes gracilis]